MLKNHSTFSPNSSQLIFFQLGDILIVHKDMPFRRFQDTDNVFQGDGFSHPAFPQDKENFSGGDLKGDMVEDRLGTEGFGDVLKSNTHANPEVRGPVFSP